jgi:hypothetical protein
MDAIYEKQRDLIKKYKELSQEEAPDREKAVDYRQEINKNYHLINHTLRAQFNWVGRYLGLTLGLTGGLCLAMYKTILFSNEGIKIRMIRFIGFPLVGGLIGYGYVRKYHSNKNDATDNKNRLRTFNEEYLSMIHDCDRVINEKVRGRKE